MASRFTLFVPRFLDAALWLTVCGSALGSEADLLAAERAYIVGDREVQISLMADKGEIMAGEPLYLTYRVENRGERDFSVLVGGDYRNRFGRPERFSVAVADKAGATLPVHDVGFEFGGIFGPQLVPAHGAHETRLFLPDWVAIAAPGAYVVTVARTLEILPAGEPWKHDTHGVDLPTSVSIRLTVVEADPQRIGALIELRGAALRGPYGTERDEATEALMAMDDQRVIPHFAAAASSRDYTLRFHALRALGRFASDEALTVLEEGLATSWRDLDNCSNQEVAESSAEGLRNSAAQALRASPHPRAREVLLKHRHDASPQVRLTAVHALGSVRSEETSEMLREMVNDEYESVQQEARRYLTERIDARPVH